MRDKTEETGTITLHDNYRVAIISEDGSPDGLTEFVYFEGGKWDFLGVFSWLQSAMEDAESEGREWDSFHPTNLREIVVTGTDDESEETELFTMFWALA